MGETLRAPGAIVVATPGSGPSVGVNALDATPARLVSLYMGRLQSAKSRETMRESLRRASRMFGCDSEDEYPWHELNLERLEELKARLVARYSPASANLALAAVRQVLDAGYFTGVVTAKQVAAARYVKNVTGSRLKKGRRIEDDELQRLWRACSRLPGHAAPRARALLAALLGGGMRREEVCQLRMAACNAKELRVIGKGNKERAIPVDEWMRLSLRAWYVVREKLPAEHNLFFSQLSAGGFRPMTKSGLWHEVRNIASLAGVVDVTGKPTIAPHDFRRTFASRLLDMGYDLTEVQVLMGHESSATTALYDKRSERELAERRVQTTIFVPSAA